MEVEAEVIKLNAGLSYATNWEKTFTDELTTSDEYTFTAIGEDQVVLYRTPVTTYIYQVEVNGGFFKIIISFFKNLFKADRTVVQK